MPPRHISNLFEYVDWIEHFEAEYAFTFENGVGLQVEFYPDPDSGEELEILRAPRQRIAFWDGTELDFFFDVDPNLECTRYRYHYFRAEPHGLIFRIELGPVPGHGFVPHIHLADDPEAKLPFPSTEFPDVLSHVGRYRALGELPIPLDDWPS